jgi:hypothetical protein
MDHIDEEKRTKSNTAGIEKFEIYGPVKKKRIQTNVFEAEFRLKLS